MELARKPIVYECCGCDRIVCEDRCNAYVDPEYWWDRGGCPLATHLSDVLADGAKGRRRVGQQKQKKGRRF